jgi:AraC-like DNA-binding protein
MPAEVMRRARDHVLSLDDEKQEMKDLFDSFDIAPLGGGEPLVKTRYAQYGPIVVSEATHGADVWVKPADNRSGYHLMFALNGRVETRYLGEDIVATGGTAVLYRPAGPVFTRLGAGVRVVNVRFDLNYLHRALESQLCEQVSASIAFSPVLDQSTHRGRSWTRMVLTLIDHLGDDSVMGNPLVALPYAESLVRGLLLTADHPYRPLLERGARPGRPAAVRIAIDLMEAEPGRPLTTSVLAAEAYVSVRTLQESFRRHLGISPMAYLRKVRLRRAHEDLRTADPSMTTVATIAHRWGFTHLGRFAAVYQTAFGEPPMATLRARR